MTFLQSFIFIFLIMRMVYNFFKTKNAKGTFYYCIIIYVVDPNTVHMTVALCCFVLFCFYPSVTLQCFVLDQCILWKHFILTHKPSVWPPILMWVRHSLCSVKRAAREHLVILWVLMNLLHLKQKPQRLFPSAPCPVMRGHSCAPIEKSIKIQFVEHLTKCTIFSLTTGLS